MNRSKKLAFWAQNDKIFFHCKKYDKNTVYPMIFITFFGFVKQIISVYHFSAKFCKISMFGIKKSITEIYT